MRVLDKGLAPGVEEGDDPQLAAEVPGVVPEGRERLRGHLKEEIGEEPRIALR